MVAGVLDPWRSLPKWEGASPLRQPSFCAVLARLRCCQGSWRARVCQGEDCCGVGAQTALHVVVRGVDEGWYALRQATFTGVQEEEWQHMNVRGRELRQELRVAGFLRS